MFPRNKIRPDSFGRSTGRHEGVRRWNDTRTSEAVRPPSRREAPAGDRAARRHRPALADRAGPGCDVAPGVEEAVPQHRAPPRARLPVLLLPAVRLGLLVVRLPARPRTVRQLSLIHISEPTRQAEI